MTHIVHGVITKKQLKAAAKSDSPLFDSVYFEDPSLFNPQSVSFATMPVGMTLWATNHPTRRWFAEVKRVDESTWRVK